MKIHPEQWKHILQESPEENLLAMASEVTRRIMESELPLFRELQHRGYADAEIVADRLLSAYGYGCNVLRPNPRKKV